jgi:hypothetical protein
MCTSSIDAIRINTHNDTLTHAATLEPFWVTRCHHYYRPPKFAGNHFGTIGAPVPAGTLFGEWTSDIHLRFTTGTKYSSARRHRRPTPRPRRRRDHGCPEELSAGPRPRVSLNRGATPRSPPARRPCSPGPFRQFGQELHPRSPQIRFEVRELCGKGP